MPFTLRFLGNHGGNFIAINSSIIMLHMKMHRKSVKTIPLIFKKLFKFKIYRKSIKIIEFCLLHWDFLESLWGNFKSLNSFHKATGEYAQKRCAKYSPDFVKNI